VGEIAKNKLTSTQSGHDDVINVKDVKKLS